MAQLVHAMQSDVSSASSDQDISRKLEELEQGLTDAHDQQAATNEIRKRTSLSSRRVRAV